MEERNGKNGRIEGDEQGFRASKVDLFFLGITIVLGGQYVAWNEGLSEGFANFAAGAGLMSFAYLNVALCLAEMISALPFSGGSYGLVRAAMGPFAGFIVGCCECVLSILYVSTSVYQLGDLISTATHAPSRLEPAYWVAFFASTAFVIIRGGAFFWNTNSLLALASMAIVLIYLLGTASFGDYDRFADPQNAPDRAKPATAFFRGLPWSSWLLVGIEMVPLASRDCEDPRTEVPVAMVSCCLALISTGIAVMFCACSQAPGAALLGEVASPLSPGFGRLLGVSEAAAAWLSVPATYATAFGFLFAYSRVMESMTASGLVPSLETASAGWGRILYLSRGSASAFALLFVLPLGPDTAFFASLLCAYVVYLCVLVSYAIFRSKFSSLQRRFHNPLGYAGAATSAAIFTGAGCSAAFLQEGAAPGVAVAVFLVTMVLLYVFFARTRQRFSSEEQRVLFSAYVINANVSRSRRRTKPQLRKAGSASRFTDRLLDLSVTLTAKWRGSPAVSGALVVPLAAVNSGAPAPGFGHEGGGAGALVVDEAIAAARGALYRADPAAAAVEADRTTHFDRMPSQDEASARHGHSRRLHGDRHGSVIANILTAGVHLGKRSPHGSLEISVRRMRSVVTSPSRGGGPTPSPRLDGSQRVAPSSSDGDSARHSLLSTGSRDYEEAVAAQRRRPLRKSIDLSAQFVVPDGDGEAPSMFFDLQTVNFEQQFATVMFRLNHIAEEVFEFDI